MNCRYVILVEFDNDDIRLISNDDSGGERTRIFQSKDEARRVAEVSIWYLLPWRIIPVDEIEEG